MVGAGNPNLFPNRKKKAKRPGYTWFSTHSPHPNYRRQINEGQRWTEQGIQNCFQGEGKPDKPTIQRKR